MIVATGLGGTLVPSDGDARYRRDCRYVGDHCQAIKLVFERGRNGESYNVGGRNEKENLWIVDTICRLLEEHKPAAHGKYTDLIAFVKDRPGHDRRYAIDATKLEQELGWRAEENLESGLIKTVSWTLQQPRCMHSSSMSSP